MRYLRTNTATRVTVGPFQDATDGVTPETAITVTACKLTLVVDTGGVPTLVLDTAPTASGGSNDMLHITGDDAGMYDLELAAGDVNYLGRALLAVTNSSVHCPVFHEFMIIPAMMYDAMVLGTDRLDTNVTHVTDTAQTAGDLAALLTTISAKTANLPSDPADASDIAALLSAVSATLSTLATATTLAAVKVKTDQLTFTKALELDVNMQSVNNVTLTGAGVLGNEFEP